MIGEIKIGLVCCMLSIFASSCTISYKLNGASIDYTKTKTISIKDFPNQAPLVYPPLAQKFTEELKDIYVRQTRLHFVNNNGDLEMEGEITGYDLTPLAVKENAYASQTKLTMTVRVRFTNRANPTKDFEQSFSANRDFDATQMLQDVQESLSKQMIQEIVDQIFNTTVADW
ncbi:MAG: LptE family protein [Parabacteroides sp.]